MLLPCIERSLFCVGCCGSDACRYYSRTWYLVFENGRPTHTGCRHSIGMPQICKILYSVDKCRLSEGQDGGHTIRSLCDRFCVFLCFRFSVFRMESSGVQRVRLCGHTIWSLCACLFRVSVFRKDSSGVQRVVWSYHLKPV